MREKAQGPSPRLALHTAVAPGCARGVPAAPSGPCSRLMLRRADSQDVTFSVYVHARDSLDPTDHWEVRLPRTPRPSLAWLVWTNLGPPVRTCPLVFRVLLFTRAVTMHFWPDS
jgi:hypothetical protein